MESPLWSYQLGLREGWIPKDPRTSAGTCAALNVPLDPAPTPYPAWQTGGTGAGPLTNAGQLTWPPAVINAAGQAAQLPQYTATATPMTLSPPAATAPNTGAQINFGSGWFNQQDSTPAYAPVQGCTYPNGWDNTQYGQQQLNAACFPGQVQ